MSMSSAGFVSAGRGPSAGARLASDRGWAASSPSISPSSGAAAARPSSGSVAVGSSESAPARDRRARAWYSGPCLRGSAYSFGLIVQYVPLDAPYQVPPDHSGSNGSSSATSYVVEPGVARFDGRDRPLPRRGPSP